MASHTLPSPLASSPTSPLRCTCLPPGLLPARLQVSCRRCSAAAAWALATMLEEEAALPACPPAILHTYKVDTAAGAWSAARAEQEDARVVANFVQKLLRTKTEEVAAPTAVPQKKTVSKKTKNLEAAVKSARAWTAWTRARSGSSLKVEAKEKKEGGDIKKFSKSVAKTNVKVKKETGLEVEVKTEEVESETEVKVKQEVDNNMEIEVKTEPDTEVVVKTESEVKYETKVKEEQDDVDTMEIDVKTEPEEEVNVLSILDKYKHIHSKQEGDDVTMEIKVKSELVADVSSKLEDGKVTMEEATWQDIKEEEEQIEEVTSDVEKVMKSESKLEVDATKKVQKSAAPKSGNQDKKVDCDKCEKTFKTKNSLKQHYTLHTGETPYGCQECPLKFPNHGGLLRHRQKIHMKKTN